jgi:hypothetical protein
MLSYRAGEVSAEAAIMPVFSGAVEVHNGGQRAVTAAVHLTGCFYHY